MRNILPGKALAIGLLLLAVQLPAATYYTEVIQSGRIRVKATTEGRSRAVGVFVSRCSERIDKLLGFNGQPQKTLTVFEATSEEEEEEDEKTSYTRVRFRPDMNNSNNGRKSASIPPPTSMSMPGNSRSEYWLRAIS